MAELGVCPATKERRTNGVHRGTNGGRACWAIAGTLCGGKQQGSFAVKVGNCVRCDFFKLVSQEEGSEIKNPNEILTLLK